jgi:hypothetical protein
MSDRDERGRFRSTGEPFVTVEVTNHQIYSKLLELDRKVDPLPLMVSDHEKRIARIERRTLQWSGGLAIIIPSITAIAGIVGVLAVTH